MGIAKFQVTVPFQPVLPENVVTNTFYLRDNLPNEWPGSTDWGALASDAATAWLTNWYSNASAPRITVKVYNARGLPPHDPIATVERNPAAPLWSPNYPTQLAMCLSYKGGQRPWQRGRMYLATWLSTGFATTNPGMRPSATMQNAALALADSLAALGGIDIDWGVYSRTKDDFFPTSKSWVDDSWDIQRRRKLDPIGRVEHTHSE